MYSEKSEEAFFNSCRKKDHEDLSTSPRALSEESRIKGDLFGDTSNESDALDRSCRRP